MAQTPQFLGPDGTYREQFTYSTTLPNRFFTGSIDADTVYMEISVHGTPFQDDPDYITFEGSTFMIPNPSAYPDGLQLVPGLNEIKIRSITTTGSVSKEAVLRARLIQDDLTSNAGIYIEPPTGITVERFDGYVKIGTTAIDSDYVTGYNFYAATEEGGGVYGYTRINVDTIQTLESETEEVVTALGTLDVNADVAADANGTHLADPQYLRLQGTQENSIGTVLQTDFNERMEIPETTDVVRVATTISKVETVTKYSFIHDRNADETSTYPAVPVSAFNAIPDEDLLYYTVTALFYDPDAGIEYESSMSMELPGSPFRITSGTGNFPMITRQQIVRDYVEAVYRSNPEVAVQPGSTLRDTMIDPFSSESERMRFILDFVHRAQSPSTLLAIDDPNFANISIPVERSEYKLALAHAFRLTDMRDVQIIIDQAFEKWASNYGAERLGGTKARGEVVLFTTKQPTASKPIPLGSVVQAGSYNFLTTSAAEITLSNIASFYDASTGRYSVRAYVQGQNPGTGYNLPAGQINKVRDIKGLFVTNPAATYGGKGLETNRELVIRVQRMIAGSEIGNRVGYKKLLAGIPKVTEAIIVGPGDALMKRDYDSTRQEHMGGKLDIWIKGENEATVSDTFAFTFEEAHDVQFEIMGNPQDLKFRAVPQSPYAALTPSNPLIEMLDFPTHLPRYGLYNATQGFWMTLTDVSYVSFDTIQLSSSHNDPAEITLTDVFIGDYRYRTSDKHEMTRQPVTSITSFSGQVGQTGTVLSAYYDLYKPNSPLLLGRSTRAGDYIQIDDSSVPTGIGQVQTVTGEVHVILGEYVEYLNFLGANKLTLEVWNEDRTTQYKPVATGELAPDYRIIDPTDASITPLGIQRTENSTITSGETLLIDYEHDENFTVTYKSNALINITQTEIDAKRRLLGDVITKHAVDTEVDISGTVVLEVGASPVTADKAIRTALLNLFASLKTGAPLRQSTAIDTINGTTGVSYLVVPLTKMCRAEGSIIVRETLDTSDAADLFEVTTWSTETVKIYLIKDELSSPTTDGGGPVTEFRGVFLNEDAQTLWDSAPNQLGAPLNSVAGGAFIIGDGGLEIPGYNDDATLQTEYPLVTDPQERYTLRTTLSQNRVLLALAPNVAPTTSSYAFSVTFIVGESTGVGNITPHDVEYLTAGIFSFTYDEDVDE